MRAMSLPAITAPALMLVAALATSACSRIQQDQQPGQVAPPVGAYSLGPDTSAGQNYSPNAGSISNGASGSSILLQEGGGVGFGMPR
jgi:hypothetical protein